MGSQVLDIGSGTGRHLEEILGLNHLALGVEPSEAMVKTARRRGVEVHTGLVECLEPNHSFDLCTAFFAVINHIATSQLANFFAAVSYQLREQGMFAVEMWAPRSANPEPTTRSFRHRGKTYLRKIIPTQVGEGCWELRLTIEHTDSDRVVVRENHKIYKHHLENLERAAMAAGMKKLSWEPLLLNPGDPFHETYIFRLIA